jgi:hypothetical protein
VTLKERNRLTDAHWDAVWARLRSEGRVDVPPEPKTPYCPSSCVAIAEYAANPGCRTNVRVVMQVKTGTTIGGGE